MKPSKRHTLTFALAIMLLANACESTPETTPADTQQEARVWVARDDGSKSCEAESGRDLRTDEGRLKDAGVPIYDSKKGDDGMMHTQVCGADTGKQNRYLIPAARLDEARKLGFEPVSN